MNAPAPDDVLRWGILGAARIAENFVGPALSRSPHCNVHAVASRRHEAAQRIAGAVGAPQTYPDYRALLADPDVDAVYIALPNAMHTEWTLAALAAGKHVLCEKPLTTTLHDAEAIRSAAREAGRVAAEAFMYRTHPQLATLVRQIRDGAIGEVHSVEAALSFVLDDPADIRMSGDLGGGALLDLGCYIADAANLVYGGPPVAGTSIRHRGETGVDLHTCGVLDYGQGRTAQLSASFLLPWHDSQLVVRGDKGSLTIDHCFNPGTSDGRLTLLTVDGQRETTTFPGVDMYERMVDRFAHAVSGRGEPHITLDESVDVQQALTLLTAPPHR
ncbi:Gfo/Idh/MocA family oxidoreductase [Actinoplanes sp. NPDC026670]|uniref:Gfo/Idh/MocA family protein n=1 Tax=Actinoplanes sp. NPDC026670 TaxID=3154700 RepID=UPI003400C939